MVWDASKEIASRRSGNRTHDCTSILPSSGLYQVKIQHHGHLKDQLHLQITLANTHMDRGMHFMQPDTHQTMQLAD